jgi:hypothetical protein
MAFGVNEALKRAFPDDAFGDTSQNTGRPDLFKPFLMGTLTGCCSAMVLLPSEIVKAKTQVVRGIAQFRPNCEGDDKTQWNEIILRWSRRTTNARW